VGPPSGLGAVQKLLKTQDSQANRLCFWAAGDEDSTPKAAEHVEDSRRDVLALTAFTKEIWTH